MRVQALLGVSLLLLRSVFSTEEEPEDLTGTTPAEPIEEPYTGPPVIATATWSDSNPFKQVVNGQRNVLELLLENKGAVDITLKSVHGSLSDPKTDAIFRNTSAESFGFPIAAKTGIKIPYTFFSEFKPTEARFRVFVDYADETEQQQIVAFDGVVSIVEPEGSWFDWKLLSTWGFVVALIGGGSYFAYLSFFPAPKKKSTRRAKPVASTEPVFTPGSGVYQEEWIPSHHLKKRKEPGVLSSGDEKSATESGTELKRRGSKRKA